MDKFNVFVKRKSRDNLGPEFADINELLLIQLVTVLSTQEDIESFTVERIV